MVSSVWRNKSLFGCMMAGIALVLAGCGGVDYKSRGKVSGKVSVNGKNLTVGSVLFINKDGVNGSASIDATGNYTMNDAPVGECQVTVTVPKLPPDPNVKGRLTGKGKGPKMPPALRDPNKPAPKEEPKEEDSKSGDPSAPIMTSVSGAVIPKNVVQIDDKYSKVETSGLSFKVERNGTQTYNIELK